MKKRILKKVLNLSFLACVSCKTFAAAAVGEKYDNHPSTPARSGPASPEDPTILMGQLQSLGLSTVGETLRIAATRAFSTIAETDRPIFVTQMNSLLPPDMAEDVRVWTICYFSQLPKTHWETLAVDAQDLFTEDMNSDNRRAMYVGIAPVLPTKRKEFISQVQELFTATMIAEERIDIVSAMAYVPPESWSQFIAQIQTLRTPDVSNTDLGIIAKRMSKVPAKDMEAFVAQINALLPPEIKSFRAAIIKAIPEGFLDSIVDFVSQIQSLVVPGMEGFEYLCIVEKMAEVRASERKEVAGAILDVTPPDVVNPKLRAAVISALLQRPYPKLRGEWSTILSSILGREIPFIPPIFDS